MALITNTKMQSPHSLLDNHNYYYKGICLLKQHWYFAMLLERIRITMFSYLNVGRGLVKEIRLWNACRRLVWKKYGGSIGSLNSRKALGVCAVGSE